MKFLKLLLVSFITLNIPIKAVSNEGLIKELKDGGKLVFIRHALAPGNGDPVFFDINKCETQRNLNYLGKEQAKKIGQFFSKNEIPIYKILSSEWCRCKETADLAFNSFETKNFLNSFYSNKFAKNRVQQMTILKEYIKNFNSDKNLILVTHYVVIAEALDYAPASGEIVVSDKNLKRIGNIEIKY